MIKKIYEYRYYFIIPAVLIGCFVSGFLLGIYETSSPSLEEIEKYNIVYAEEAPDVVPVAEPEEEKPEYITLGVFNVTAYCPCEKCCGKSDGITATGTHATAGRTIAVDPKVIPYGTEVIINGHTYIAEDCGGSVTGKTVDIYFSNHAEALAFGRQQLEVKIRC